MLIIILILINLQYLFEGIENNGVNPYRCNREIHICNYSITSLN